MKRTQALEEMKSTSQAILNLFEAKSLQYNPHSDEIFDELKYTSWIMKIPLHKVILTYVFKHFYAMTKDDLYSTDVQERAKDIIIYMHLLMLHHKEEILWNKVAEHESTPF